MTSRDTSAASAACDEIEQLLNDTVPAPDEARRNRIRFLCARICVDSYTTSKANKLAERAAIYFSARRHQQERGGADAVMHEMRRSLLGAIREQLRWLEERNG